MTFAGERAAVQNPFIRYAQEAGWTYLPPDEALRLRGGMEHALLRPVLVEMAQRLNPHVDAARAEDLARRIERVAPRIEGNLDAWEYLKGLKTVFVPEEKRERNTRLVDAEHWEANCFHVTDELRFTNGARTIRLDIAFFVNGIPVLVVETKAAYQQEGIAQALDQLRRYHREGPELMALLQVQALTHLVHFYYGPTWNLSRKGLFNWKEQAAGDFETLVKTFVHPQRVLRVILDFILFTRKDDELGKVILHPHQMRAVERIVRRATDPDRRRALVWHTQGSGKTYTMITVARQLIANPLFENPTVLLLVDRNELESQLFGVLRSLGVEYAEAETKRHLRDLLQSDRRGVIVSTIHKFDDMPANVNLRRNVFVLVDEAHRTTGGALGTYLMAALPNATLIGFTGTPIDRGACGRGTFQVFGCDDPQGYLDKYSIAESIADGTTVPLRYTLAPSDLRVDRQVLDREFLDLKEAEGVSDVEELDRILQKAVTLRNILKNPTRMDRVAAYVAEHYLHVVEPMGYKAFLVGVDREACALYKDALDRYLPPDYSAVVYSAAYNDDENLARFHLSKDAERRLRQDFRDPDKLPRILIVTEKLLTGFDAPVLYCMYLDKPMRDHVLLQAIARVNRPYEDKQGRHKPSGFVLDFVGIFENLEKALAFDSQDIEGVIEELQVLRDHFAALMEQARAEVLPLTRGQGGRLSPDKAAEAVLEHYRDGETRQAFYRFFREVQDLFEVLSPDAFLRPYLDDYETLSRIVRLLREAYEPGVSVDRDFQRKTEALVRRHVESSAIRDTLEVYEINEHLLVKIAASEQPDTVKVFNYARSIQALIEARAVEAPYLLSIGERAEQVILAYQERQATTQQTLARLEDLIREINAAEVERARMALPGAAFAVYWILHREGLPGAREAAERMDAVFRQYPHWRVSESQRRAVRTELYKALFARSPAAGKVIKESGPEYDPKSLVDQIFRVVEQAQG
ncbi:MAG TPA: HsdR family type I site-specific deoxyribonuclease [Anaerolineae bacterium]|nr:HsdR family type I site-specific deoxyribonuclease [Anaerolineae bacterium]